MATIVKLDADERAGRTGSGLGQLLANMFNDKQDKKRAAAVSKALTKLSDSSIPLEKRTQAVFTDLPSEIYENPTALAQVLSVVNSVNENEASGRNVKTAEKRVETEETGMEADVIRGQEQTRQADEALAQRKDEATADQILRKFGLNTQADELRVRVSEGQKDREAALERTSLQEVGATGRTILQGETARDVAGIRSGLDGSKRSKAVRDETSAAIKQIDDTLTKFSSENGIAIFEKPASKAAVTGAKESAGELVARGLPFQDAFSISMGQVYQDTVNVATQAAKDPQQAEIYKYLAKDVSILRSEYKKQYGMYPEDFEADFSKVDKSELQEFDINNRDTITEVTVNQKGTDVPAYTTYVTLINGRIVPLSPTMYNKYGQ